LTLKRCMRVRAICRHRATIGTAWKTMASARVCCSSPEAICYWFGASLIAWGILSFAELYWHPLRWYAASTALLAMGIGCVANWSRNRSFHCAITAPLFLIAGVLFALGDLGLLRVNASFVWLLVLFGTITSFALEWRYTRRAQFQ